MDQVGQIERRTQDRIIHLFRDQLHYFYLGNWEDRPNNRNIEEKPLRNFLVRHGYRPELIERAVSELKRVVCDQSQDLYYINRDVYELLRYGVKVSAVAEEVTVSGENTKRPDVVLYLNGIAVGVLELAKKSPHCLEYIVVHEMMHLLERLHNDRFRALMSRHLPNWEFIKAELNHEPLAHEEWEY